MIKQIYILLFVLIMYPYGMVKGQSMPSVDEHFDFLTTYSKEASTDWGDDDHIQIYFIAIPKDYKENIYISIYDPDVGGKHDQLVGYGFNSKTKFSLYGGEGAYTGEDGKKINPSGNFKSGQQISSKLFGIGKIYDDQWFSFGPFSPDRGEYIESLNANVFKLIIEGLEGDDGNMYRFYCSSSNFENVAVTGIDCFTYELSCRFKKDKNSLAHVFPFISADISKINFHSFDADNEGRFQLTTSTKKSHKMKLSGDNNWEVSEHVISAKGKNKFIDIQYISDGSSANDVVMYVTDQNENIIPLHCFPNGGKPKYNYKISIEHKY